MAVPRPPARVTPFPPNPMALSSETTDRLRQVSTATLTTQLFKRGLRNVFIQGVRRMSAASGNLVGEAFTLRYIPAREDLDALSVFEDPEHPQRKAIETVPSGQVLVMDCRRDTRAASGGSILLMRLKVRGAAGIVTDGGLRDSEVIAKMDFSVYGAGGSAPLNLAIHHAVAWRCSRATSSSAMVKGSWLFRGILPKVSPSTRTSRISSRSSCSSKSRRVVRCLAPIRPTPIRWLGIAPGASGAAGAEARGRLRWRLPRIATGRPDGVECEPRAVARRRLLDQRDSIIRHSGPR
jgi:regulator of RNase E activity RraA